MFTSYNTVYLSKQMWNYRSKLYTQAAQHEYSNAKLIESFFFLHPQGRFLFLQLSCFIRGDLQTVFLLCVVQFLLHLLLCSHMVLLVQLKWELVKQNTFIKTFLNIKS